jgi:hypothetical protein
MLYVERSDEPAKVVFLPSQFPEAPCLLLVIIAAFARISTAHKVPLGNVTIA